MPSAPCNPKTVSSIPLSLLYNGVNQCGVLKSKFRLTSLRLISHKGLADNLMTLKIDLTDSSVSNILGLDLIQIVSLTHRRSKVNKPRRAHYPGPGLIPYVAEDINMLKAAGVKNEAGTGGDASHSTEHIGSVVELLEVDSTRAVLVVSGNQNVTLVAKLTV